MTLTAFTFTCIELFPLVYFLHTVYQILEFIIYFANCCVCAYYNTLEISRYLMM
jgi:hypothetical protein